MVFLLSFCVYSILINIIKCQKFLKGEFMKINSYRLYSLLSTFGPSFYRIDQQSEYTYCEPMIFDFAKVIEKKDIQINNETFTRCLIYEPMLFFNVSVPIFSYYFPDSSSPVETGISFAFSFKNESFSIMHSLKKNNVIDRMIYSFSPVSPVGGDFYIGAIPPLKNYKYKFECDIIDDQWGCISEGAMLNNSNTQYTSKHKALFQTGTQNIYVPNDFLDFFVGKFFKPYFDNKSCFFYVNDELNFKSFECNSSIDVQQILPKIFTVIINNIIFEVEMSKLYYHFYIEHNMLIRFHLLVSMKEEQKDLWIMGAILFDKYISAFDYENKKVMFYNYNPFIIYKNSTNLLYYFFIAIFGNVFFGTIFSIIIKVYITQNKNITS